MEARARHPQDGPHVDLRFRLENTEFLAEISMNLVFLDWMIQSSREDEERIDASELALLQPRLLQTLSQQMPVSIDGVRVEPVLRTLTSNDPDQALLPLFPLSGWRGLRDQRPLPLLPLLLLLLLRDRRNGAHRSEQRRHGNGRH